MKKFFLLPLAVLSLVTFNSCKKDETDPVDENKKPTISLTPVSGTYAISGSDTTMVFEAITSDSDGSISLVRFYQDGNILSTDNSAPYKIGKSSIATGQSFVIKAVVEDNQGATASKEVSISVISK